MERKTRVNVVATILAMEVELIANLHLFGISKARYRQMKTIPTHSPNMNYHGFMDDWTIGIEFNCYPNNGNRFTIDIIHAIKTFSKRRKIVQPLEVQRKINVHP